ncbi:uncharacterized protein [Fopius arisanus]|nr:PREDICTED: uncharacterized protein LOC105269475 isoform X2 [Fopius arisanus]XP_011308071.1 PREDICTED: uncharacterized protein LOC105269475 isoform X2 [Fopius arisanus]
MMIFSRHPYFWYLLFFNLFGIFNSQPRNSPEYEKDASSSITPPTRAHRFFLTEKNQLIKEVNTDVKTLLRYFPGVSDGITSTSRSLGEMKSYAYTCLNEIKDIRTEIALIKFQTMYLPMNLTKLSQNLEIRDQTMLQRVTNGTKIVSGGLVALGKYYISLRNDYRAIRRDLRRLIEMIANATEAPPPEDQPIYNQATTTSALISTPNHWPMIEHQLNTSNSKLHDLTLSQEQIKSRINEAITRSDNGISRLEQKIEMALAGLNADNKVVHERIINDILRLMQQMSDLKSDISSTCGSTSPHGIKNPSISVHPQHYGPNRIHSGKITSKFVPPLNLAQLFEYWSVVNRFQAIYQKLLDQNPVVGLGGAIGVGKLMNLPRGLPDYTGLMGGFSGLALIPDDELINLKQLFMESLELMGIMPKFQNTSEGWYDEPIGTPRPAPPAPIDSWLEPWFHTESTIFPTDSWGFGEGTTEHPHAFPGTHVPPEIIELEGLPPTPRPTLPSVPDPPYQLVPSVTDITGIPGLMPEESADEMTDGITGISNQSSEGITEGNGEPTVQQSPTVISDSSTRPSIIAPTPADVPEPPTLLEPITVLKATGLEGHCACSCPCACTCPILPIELPTTASRQWWTGIYHLKRPKKLNCKCLCACPCPPEYIVVPPITDHDHDHGHDDDHDHTHDQDHDHDDDHPYYDDLVPPISASPTTDTKHDDKYCEKVGDLARRIDELRADFQIMRLTVRDEMVITREAIVTQMNDKFLAVSAALATSHYKNAILHSNDKNATDNVRNLVKRQFMRSHYMLRRVTGAVGRVQSAVRAMLKNYPQKVGNPQDQYDNPYGQARRRYMGMERALRPPRDFPDDNYE